MIDDSYSIEHEFNADGEIRISFVFRAQSEAELLRDFPCLRGIPPWEGKRPRRHGDRHPFADVFDLRSIFSKTARNSINFEVFRASGEWIQPQLASVRLDGLQTFGQRGS